MGSICSSASAVQNREYKPVFPKRKHEGKMTESAEKMTAMMMQMGEEAGIYSVDTIAQRRQEQVDMMAMMFGSGPNKVYFDAMAAKCDRTQFDLPVNGGTIKVFCLRPKDLPKDGNACEIHAHGGAAIMCSADMFNDLMCEHAVLKKCVYFNVDYRKGPETRCPGGQQDFATAIEHIYSNSEKYGINKKQICASGISGGSWICLGAMHLLAKANKAHMIKAQFLWVPMISNENQDTPIEKLQPFEMPAAAQHQCYRLLATDYDNQQKDEQLYPGRCTDSQLAQVPPFAIFTSEFCFIRKDALKLAERGKKLGKLLDISDLPGAMHGHMGEPAESQVNKEFYKDQCFAFDKWIRDKK